MREPRPVKRVELSENNQKLRILAAVMLLLIGAIGITVGIMSLLQKETGWQRVQVTPQERSCSESFILQYHFSGTGAEATTVNNKLQTVYGEACVKAYQLFTADEEIAGVNNIYYINHHPNEEIVVDPVLYAAFEKTADTPWLYLGPVYAHYNQIIYNSSEEYVDQLDPLSNGDAAAYVLSTARYATDPEMIKLELLGDNRILLQVSQTYLAYAEGEEMEQNFIDFSYMTNAFVIDYLAEALIKENLTEGYLVSADGYTRNLDSKHQFHFNIFDRIGDTVYPAGVMTYRGPISIVYLKDYPTAESDSNYRAKEDRYIHLFADPVDGICRTSVENLVSYSYDMGCADVLLKMLPCFVGDDFVIPEDVFSIWCEDELICYNDDAITVKDLFKSEEMSYRVALKQ